MSFDILLKREIEIVKKVVWNRIKLNALRIEIWSKSETFADLRILEKQ